MQNAINQIEDKTMSDDGKSIIEHQLFKTLTFVEKKLIQANMENGSILPREYLFQHDRKLEYIYFIRKGLVLEGRNKGKQNEHIAFLHGNPIFLGTETLLFSADNSFFKALSDVYYSKIDIDLFYQVLIKNNDFHDTVRKQITGKLVQLEEKFNRLYCNVKYRKVTFSERFKYFLIELINLSRVVIKVPFTINIHITHMEIAQYISSTRQFVTFNMNKMRGDGIIEYSRSKIIILDYNRLLSWECESI